MTTVVGVPARRGADELPSPSERSVVLAGGGTAGHTSPLIATAHELGGCARSRLRRSARPAGWRPPWSRPQG